MSELMDKIGTPSVAEKRALLMHSLQRRMAVHLTSGPLSHGQSALWFLQRSEPDSAAYHVAFSVRIRSHLDVAALRRACQHLVNRHEALRTTYTTRNGAPLQVIHAHRAVSFEQVATDQWSRAELERRVIEAYRQPFDLERGPLLRVNLFSGAATDHVLLLTVHHIAFDAWSLWILQDELCAAYTAECNGAPPTLPQLRHFYTDYVRWQNEMLESARGQVLWNYWQHQLSGASTVLNLPCDRPRPAVQSHHGASFSFQLPAELSAQLKNLARETAVTPFTLLLAAFQVLLFRYSGQEDILVGSPTAGRGQTQFRNVIGYFVNPVVLRARLGGNPTFREFLQQVQQTVLEGMVHADYPFPLLVQRLQPARDASFSPLFQVSFVLQKAQREGELSAWVPGDTQRRMRWGTLEVELYELAQQEGQFDLELEMLEAGQAFHAVFKYNPALFEAQRIAQMAQSLSVLLAAIVEQPTQGIGQLPLLTPTERAHLLERGKARVDVASATPCLHRWFEQQVHRNPQAIAISCEGRSLDYGELNARANRLAHHLQSLGVGPEVLVGILLERSLDMIVALLGVLKAGGAYLPLDPASPAERLAFIVADSSVPLLITHSTLPHELPVRSLCIDTQWPQIELASPVNPASNVCPDHLAYVIYTSGSTGRPKGAQVTHRNVARLFTSTAAWYGFDERDVWTLYHSFAFDFSVWEIWGALLYGGRVVVVPHLVSRAPDEFLQLLEREQVTVLNQTPSAFRVLQQAEARQSARLSLRYIIFGGEQLDPQTLRPWFDRHGDVRPQLVNMYGITETTVHVTYRPLTRQDLASACSVIGVPLADLEIYLLDPHLQPVPVGVGGEIYVGGAGVARGYLNRPELNTEKFIPHPFVSKRRARLYRSGDLARRLPNGDIEYLGRIDNQVKIRGFRIELGEIETVLVQHPQVREALVTVHKQRNDDVRLIAYVVGSAEAGIPDVPGLRNYLLQKLPAYMVPAAFVALERLPLTNNGKIDHAALPKPEQEAATRELIAARDATEERLVQVWQDILGVKRIGIRDNFFEVGGHSLLAVALMEHIERDFQQRLPIATLFRQPTIEQLAQLLRQPATAPAWSPLVPIQARGSLQPFFCVAGGGGNVLYFQALARALGEDQPFYGLQAAGLDGGSPPLERIEDIARAHLQALQAMQPTGPYLLGGHCFGGVVAYEMAQQLQHAGHKVALVAIMDIPAPTAQAATASALDEAAWLVRIAAGIEEVTGKQLHLSYPVLKQLDGEQQLRLLMQGLQHIGFLPATANLEQVRGLVEVSKANVRALMQFLPRDTRPTPLVLLRAAAVHRDYAYGQAGTPLQHDTLGWERYACGTLAIDVVPGNHLTMLAEPHVQVLAQRLAERLRAAQTLFH